MGGLCEERSRKGRGGRPRLRWEDCVKRDLGKAEKEVERKRRHGKNNRSSRTGACRMTGLTPTKQKREKEQ